MAAHAQEPASPQLHTKLAGNGAAGGGGGGRGASAGFKHCTSTPGLGSTRLHCMLPSASKHSRLNTMHTRTASPHAPQPPCGASPADLLLKRVDLIIRQAAVHAAVGDAVAVAGAALHAVGKQACGQCEAASGGAASWHRLASAGVQARNPCRGGRAPTVLGCVKSSISFTSSTRSPAMPRTTCAQSMCVCGGGERGGAGAAGSRCASRDQEHVPGRRCSTGASRAAPAVAVPLLGPRPAMHGLPPPPALTSQRLFSVKESDTQKATSL